MMEIENNQKNVLVIITPYKERNEEIKLMVSVPENDPKGTIYNIKKAVGEQVGIHPIMQRLKIAGDTDSFQFPTTVSVYFRDRNPTMKIKISDFNEKNGEVVQLDVDPEDTVLDLKYSFAEKISKNPLNPFFVKLFKNDLRFPERIELKNATTVSQAELKNDECLYFMFAFPSGIKGHSDIFRTSLEYTTSIAPNAPDLYSTFMNSVKKNGKGKLFGTRYYRKTGRLSGYRWISYWKAAERVKNFASGLRHLGINEGDKVGIISQNRTEWVLSDLACMSQSFVSVPLYDTLGREAMEYIVKMSEMRCIITSWPQLKFITEIRKMCPKVELVVLMDDNFNPSEFKEFKKVQPGTIYTHTFSKVEEIGKKHQYEPCPPTPMTLYTICYTSGTTSLPKGVMISHQNILSAAAGLTRRIPEEDTENEVMLSYLPLAHIYERVLQLMFYSQGHSIGFYQGDVTKLLEDIEELKPTFFPGVPRVWLRLYDKINNEVYNGNFIKKWLFETGMESKKAQLRVGDDTTSYWDTFVFSKVAAKFGGNLRFFSSGSAPLSGDVVQFLTACLMSKYGEGYGLTETCAGLTSNAICDRVTGHVGTPISSCEMKLVEVPEMNYFVSGKIPKGEIWVRGPCVFSGYFKNPEATQECLEDGWFQTGDIGLIRSDGNLQIIDRKKNIFKLAQGEYIRPEYIEAIYKNNRYIAMIFAYGDSTKSSLVGIVVPDFDALSSWASTQDDLKAISNKPQELVKNQKVKKFVFENMKNEALISKLRGFEKIQNIELISEDFSVDNGLLTPTFKLKRHEAKLSFTPIIEKLYLELEQQESQKKMKSKL